MNKHIFFVFGGVLLGIFFLSAAVNEQGAISYDRGADYAGGDAEGSLPPPPQHIETPVPVRAIYMTSWVGGTKDWREELVRFIEATELNSIVIDVKDYSGTISFLTGNIFIEEVGAEENRIPDMREFIAALHEKNIYVIARITAFQDPHYSKKHVEDAVLDDRGGLWKDRNGLTYVDPLARDFWDYLVQVAVASEGVGFDELNFDYIRYPSDGPIRHAVFPYSKPGITKADVMEEFFQYLQAKLSDLGVPRSADLFGFTTYYDHDLNIGQVLERAEPYFDYIAPMVYPSHYPDGFNGYANPAQHPYEIVHLAMTSGVERMIAASSTPLKLRPWLQDFDLGAVYDETMIRKEKQAVYDAGLDSWMMWDPSNQYTRSAYDTVR